MSVAGTPSKAMADQFMTADKARLKTRVGELSKADMLAVEAAMRVQLALSK